VWNTKHPKIAKAIQSIKNKPGDIILLDFKIYNGAVVTKITWHWHKKTNKDRQIEQKQTQK
jgi:hypothetical protein